MARTHVHIASSLESVTGSDRLGDVTRKLKGKTRTANWKICMFKGL